MDCMPLIVGTKLDLTAARQVTREEAERFASQHKAAYYETSAKDNHNVTAVFDRIGFQCLAAKLSSEVIPDSVSLAADKKNPVCCSLQ